MFFNEKKTKTHNKLFLVLNCTENHKIQDGYKFSEILRRGAHYILHVQSAYEPWPGPEKEGTNEASKLQVPQGITMANQYFEF